MKIQVNKNNVGLRIKQLRLDKGYTLEAFGKLFDGATKGNVQQWEQGRSLPNKERIKAIAKFGDMTVNELLYGSVEEFITENFFQLHDKYKNLNKQEITELKMARSRRLAILNTISSVVKKLEKKSVNINNIDELIDKADDFINDEMGELRKRLIGFSFVDTLQILKKEDILELIQLYNKILNTYELSEDHIEALSNIALYMADNYNDDPIVLENVNNTVSKLTQMIVEKEIQKNNNSKKNTLPFKI